MLILTSSSNYVISSFVTHLPKKPNELKLTFIPTAAEVEEGDMQWLDDDRQTLVDAGFQMSDFTVTAKSKNDVKTMLENTDAVFVAGGNTFFLLQEMNKSNFTELIKEYVNNGMIYIGSSAGSVVAGPDISLIQGLDDPALAPELIDCTGLALTDVTVFPHWGSEHFQSRYENVMKSGYQKGLKIVLLTDDQYLVADKGKYSIESI